MLEGLVIAGSYVEFIDWIRENQLPLSNFKYISSPDSWRGHHRIKVYRVGQYWLNPAYGEIKHYVDDAWWLL